MWGANFPTNVFSALGTRLQTIVDIDSSQTLKFYWKVSYEEDSDYLEFYIDETRQDRRINMRSAT